MITISIVDRVIFLGVLITNYGVTDEELRRRNGKMCYRKSEAYIQRYIYRGIRLTIKIMIVQSLVFPIILYGVETWTIKKSDRKTIDAFELWCWRKLLGVTYLDRKRSTEIIEII